jgi:hypothetical protein
LSSAAGWPIAWGHLVRLFTPGMRWSCGERSPSQTAPCRVLRRLPQPEHASSRQYPTNTIQPAFPSRGVNMAPAVTVKFAAAAGLPPDAHQSSGRRRFDQDRQRSGRKSGIIGKNCPIHQVNAVKQWVRDTSRRRPGRVPLQSSAAPAERRNRRGQTEPRHFARISTFQSSAFVAH